MSGPVGWWGWMPLRKWAVIGCLPEILPWWSWMSPSSISLFGHRLIASNTSLQCENPWKKTCENLRNDTIRPFSCHPGLHQKNAKEKTVQLGTRRWQDYLPPPKKDAVYPPFSCHSVLKDPTGEAGGSRVVDQSLSWVLFCLRLYSAAKKSKTFFIKKNEVNEESQ